MALSNKRKYPAAEFTSFVASARRYVESIGRDPLIHREVVNAINGVRSKYSIRRSSVPSRRLAVVIEQHSKIPIVPESRSTIDFILMPGKNWRSSIILLLATSGSLFELHVGPR